MQMMINGNRLELIVGDITKQQTEAIVNAANGTLLGGGGVDGAIHRVAGKDLLKECKQIRKTILDGKGLPTGKAVITKGYNLPANYVIHTVGPIWQENPAKQEEQLSNCYANSLLLAKEKSISSISFPSISTGVYRYPIDEAANIALSTVLRFLENNEFGEVYFTLFSEKDYNVHAKTLKDL